MKFYLYHRPRKKGEMRSERALAQGAWKRVTDSGTYLEHGPILEDMLLITHHTVLIQCWNPLLCILHDLGREEIVIKSFKSVGRYGK